MDTFEKSGSKNWILVVPFVSACSVNGFISGLHSDPMRKLLIPIAAFASLAAYAQPVIPAGNNSYLPGDAPAYSYINSFSEPTLGEESAYWDLSSFVGEGELSSVIVPPPSSAPEGTTVSELSGEDQFTHYYTSDEVLFLVGVDLSQIQYVCTDPIEILHYPMMFGSQFEDTHDCVGELLGSPYTRSGSGVITGSSWGTLNLPYGLFENVLMVRNEMAVHEVWDDPSGGEFDATITTYQFLKAGMRAPLMMISITEFNDQATGTTFVMDGATIGMEEGIEDPIGIEVMPNPATDHIVITYSATGHAMTMEIIDPSGRVVRSIGSPISGVGIAQGTFSISDLPQGVYHLRIWDARGQIGTRSFIKH